MRSRAEKSLDAVKDAVQNLTPAINAREKIFEPLSQLVTRVINALDASGASDHIVKDARTLARKITGKRTSAKNSPLEEGVTSSEKTGGKSISASQMSFDQRLDNFKELITLLSKEPLYKPNEPELSVKALTEYANNLKAKNTAVINAATPASNSRINRDKILYDKPAGLVDIAFEVKKYVKSAFKQSSPEYNQVSGLEFKRP